MKSPILIPLLTGLLCWSAGPLSAKSHQGKTGAGTHPGTNPPPAGDEQTTHFEFKHVNFHIDETVILQIENLRGELLPAKAGVPPDFDDRSTLLLQIDGGEAAMSTVAFATLMNRYVFNYGGTPLTNVRVTPEGNELHLTATLNKTVPVEMTGTLSATADGRIHYHPTTIKTAGIPAKGVMDAVGLNVNKLVKGTDPRGVDVVKDDLIMDLDRLLPPPRVHTHVAGVKMEGSRVAMTFGPTREGGTLPALTPPVADASNYMYYHGGTVRFGKLTMAPTEMEFIDAHPEDAFDFSLTHYYDQLIAGYTKTNATGALISYVPDYRQLEQKSAPPDLGPSTPPDAATPTPADKTGG